MTRHTQRFDDARGQLKQLQRLEAAGKWQLEIRREWEYLAREQQADDISSASPADTEPEAAEIPEDEPKEENQESSSPADVPHAA